MNRSIETYKCMLVKENTVNYMTKEPIGTPMEAYQVALTLGYETFSEEVFGVFCLNTKGIIVAYHEVSHGSLAQTIIHPREVFKRALLSNASAIICVHNHPSGILEPSLLDIETTKRLIDAGKVLGIEVLDHIIIGEDGYYSISTEDEN